MASVMFNVCLPGMVRTNAQRGDEEHLFWQQVGICLPTETVIIDLWMVYVQSVSVDQ